MAERIWQRWIIPLNVSAHSSGYRSTANDAHSASNPGFEEGRMEKPWYFIQLSDTHIVADTRQESMASIPMQRSAGLLTS